MVPVERFCRSKEMQGQLGLRRRLEELREQGLLEQLGELRKQEEQLQQVGQRGQQQRGLLEEHIRQQRVLELGRS